MTKKIEKASTKASPKLMDALNVAVTIVSKVMEVIHWIGAVALIIVAIFGFTGGAFPGSNGDLTSVLQGLNIYGFEAEIINNSLLNFSALGWFSLGGALTMAVIAMIFRNVYLIAKSSREKTPFTKDNLRRVKELGIFFIAVPVISLIFSIIISLVTGVEISTNSEGVITGLIMLYLTQIFARGVELEDDVKDLV